MFHKFITDVSQISRPKKFTCPFFYTPHQLCVLARNQVISYIKTQKEWQEELQRGKMFGVLVVEDKDKEIGFLSAFSGQIAQSNIHEYFVPPVYDILSEDSFFLLADASISAINREISTIEKSEEFCKAQNDLKNFQEYAKSFLSSQRQKMKQAKTERDKRRKELANNESELIKESQFQKAEYKRLEKKLREQLDSLQKIYFGYLDKLNLLREDRKKQSSRLQHQLFDQFVFLNAFGETKSLCEIFTEYNLQPPAGAGECAAPRLLQYAFKQNLKPIAMAEFWWGDSPTQEIRQHGNFYPACKHKCEPILTFMLQGLQVEENKLLIKHDFEVKIIYEDDFLLVVDKPAGMLSVQGKNHQMSVFEWVKNKYPTISDFCMVHRLDMATSGLLLIAKTADICKKLQQQFALRQIKKKYIAILDGCVQKDSGYINLPIRADYENRPYQLVDEKNGKEAVTYFEVLERNFGRTRVAFYPQTGRTHQLRVHAAHNSGLSCPIVGDDLYGSSSDRLYLHAEQLEFTHPVSQQLIVCKSETIF